ncbi:hypothetical protein G9A89_014775 [Geosiphon pyriformis]|nr:hypothetical protein G9A89_014775 [Geosiphon pyriformis]
MLKASLSQPRNYIKIATFATKTNSSNLIPTSKLIHLHFRFQIKKSILKSVHVGDYDTAIKMSNLHTKYQRFSQSLHIQNEFNQEHNTRAFPTSSSQNWILHIICGDSAGLKGDWEEALRQFDAAMMLSSSVNSGPCKENLYFRMCNAFLEIGKRVPEKKLFSEYILRSKELASEGLGYFKTSQILHHLVGSSHLLLKDYTSAIDYFSKSICYFGFIPDYKYFDTQWFHVKSTIGMGIALHQSGKYQEAVDIYEQGLELLEKACDKNIDSQKKKNYFLSSMQDEFLKVDSEESLIQKSLEWSWWSRPGYRKELHLQKLAAITIYNLKLLQHILSFESIEKLDFSSSLPPSPSSPHCKIKTFPTSIHPISKYSKSILLPTNLSVLHHLAGYNHLYSSKNEHQAAYKQFLDAQLQDSSILEGWIARRDILKAKRVDGSINSDNHINRNICDDNNRFADDAIDSEDDWEYDHFNCEEGFLEKEMHLDVTNPDRLLMIDEVIAGLMREEWGGGQCEHKQGVKARIGKSVVEEMIGFDIMM